MLNPMRIDLSQTPHKLSFSAVKLYPSGRRYKAQANLAFVVVDVGEKSITI